MLADPSERQPQVNWEVFRSRLRQSQPITQKGRIEEVIGLVIEALGPAGSMGDLCGIQRSGSDEEIPAEIVGFRSGRTLLMPLGPLPGIAPGDGVVSRGNRGNVGAGWGFLGRVVNGMGVPIDGKGPIAVEELVPLYRSPTDPMHRRRVTEVLATGIKALDGLVTLGEGQRVGVFSGSGVGKSTLLGMIARYTAAEINVVALVGERSREVREFIERDLGEEGLEKSVVVVATSDQPALRRIRAAHLAMALAEWFRDREKKVLFMMDSITRMALAQREIGLAIGEPPATRGFTPSVFTMLPRFLERCGTSEGRGSITGLITVLVEGDDMNEPVSDTTRGILDGHVVLARRLADRNHYPAIDPLRSGSRVMNDIVDNRHRAAAAMIRGWMATYEEMEDMINLGAYQKGTNREVDVSIEKKSIIDRFLKQDIENGFQWSEIRDQLVALATEAGRSAG